MPNLPNWSNWLDWGGGNAPVRSLNELHGPTTLGTPYQWLRPPGAPFPTPSGAQFPMFGPTGGQMYPMFGGGAGVPNVSVGAGPMAQMGFAERAAAAGYPLTTSGHRMSFDLPVRAPGSAVVPYTGGTVPVKNPYTGNLAEFRSAQQARVMPQPGTVGQPALGWDPHAEQRAANEASWGRVNDSARRAKEAADRTTAYAKTMGFDPDAPRASGAGSGPVPGSGRPSTPPPGTPTGQPLPTRTPGTAGPTYGNVNMGGGASGGAAGAPTPGATPGAGAGAGGSPTPGAGNASAPTNPYAAFWGRNPLNVRGALSPTGSVGSKLPGFLTQYRGFGPSPTGAVGSRLPNFLTQPLGTPNPGVTGWRARLSGPGANMAAGLGAQIALHAVGSGVPMAYESLTGRPVSQQGYETSRSTAGLAATALPFFGAPVAAAVGAGAALGDVIGSAEGAGVANFLRENVLSHAPEWMPGDMEDWGPTNDGIGDILGRIPWGIGSILGGTPEGEILGGTPEGEQQQAQDPIAALPPTPESIATVGQMAGLDPSSTGFLQQQFNNSVALSMAQYTADPEGFKKQFEAVHGRPMESEADISQVLFSKIVGESLPAALENQSAQAAALQNAAMYQDFISQYMAPIRDQYNDLGARASAAGYGDLALQFQGQGVSQESAMRAIPSLEALRAQQAQVNQLAQAQWQSSMSGTGSTGTDPLGDASTLAALGVPTG